MQPPDSGNVDAEDVEASDDPTLEALLAHPFVGTYRTMLRAAAAQVRRADAERALAREKLAGLRAVTEAFAAGATSATTPRGGNESAQSAAQALQECMDALDECGSRHAGEGDAALVLCAAQYTACIATIVIHGPSGGGGGRPPSRPPLATVLQADAELEDPAGYPWAVDHGRR
ncbi:hypothetical protein [Actinomycetospora termitidis]|uniref:Pectinesterase inhibitor domain-containing protein n=1 Tax=Actinomycetospora termitidis TaxID=3053470 RepID=A0ABT7M2M8_9PSEU|nr:hypothetical protein [Actinomycetospora sp. Odt1-22]MDL5154914.1 hypothetical protein [Actinomycetospora sp. Odt1-22]